MYVWRGSGVPVIKALHTPKSTGRLTQIVHSHGELRSARQPDAYATYTRRMPTLRRIWNQAPKRATIEAAIR